MDSVDQHLHSVTLTIKDEDMEYEWRLLEISNRKNMAVICTAGCIVQDVMYTVILSEVSTTGRMIKLIIDVILILFLKLVFFVRKVKENKKTMETLAST